MLFVPVKIFLLLLSQESRVLFDVCRCKEGGFVLTPAVRANERLNSLALGRSKIYPEKVFCL